MKYTPPKNSIIEHKEPQRYNIVIKSNKLIQKSRFSLSILQQKIILYIISQIEPRDQELKIYEFKITDFCRVCGIEAKGDMYNLLKREIKAISDQSIWIEIEEGNETLVRWIEKPYIDKRSGTIKIKLDDDMKPFLLQLKEKFTSYELIYTLNYKSKYSIRLYEYLKSIHYKSLEPYTQTIKIEKFQKILDSNYSNFKDFHTRVLKPAYNEINKYSDLDFQYELISAGRKVIEIKITVQAKEVKERLSTAYNNDIMLDEKGGKQ